jgi:hypothetical protein
LPACLIADALDCRPDGGRRSSADRRISAVNVVAASFGLHIVGRPQGAASSNGAIKEKLMKRLVKSALVAAAAGVTLAGCATYDYGYGYSDTQPYYGYEYGYNSGYDYGPYSYDYTPYYSGPSYYVAPSVGLGFTYRDRDHDRDHDRGYHERNYSEHRYSDTRHDNNYHRNDAEPWRAGRDDPWGGTNKPNDRTSQQ